MGNRPSLDWAKIETDYVKGFLKKLPDGTRTTIYPTYEELADKYDCCWNTLAIKGAKEKWLNKRELYQQKLKSYLLHENANLSDSVRYDTQNLLRLERIGELVDKWIEDKLTTDEEGNHPYFEPKELSCMVDVLTKSHNLARSIFGEDDKFKKPRINNNIQFNKKELNIIDMQTLDNLAQIIQSRRKNLN